MNENDNFESMPTRKLSELYVKKLQEYKDVVKILELTTEMMIEHEKLIINIEKELTNRNIVIKEDKTYEH